MIPNWYLVLLLGLAIVYLVHRLNFISFERAAYFVMILLAVTLSVPWSQVTRSWLLGALISLASVGWLTLMAREALKRRKNRNRK
jgi:hypothetical protein